MLQVYAQPVVFEARNFKTRLDFWFRGWFARFAYKHEENLDLGVIEIDGLLRKFIYFKKSSHRKRERNYLFHININFVFKKL